MTKRKNFPVLAALMGNILMGLDFVFSKSALEYTKPFVLETWRLFIALAAMTIYAKVRGIKLPVRGRNMTPIIISGICDPLIYFVFVSYGVKLTNASFSGIMIAMIPIFTIVASAIFLKEKANGRQWIFTVAGIAAIAAISLHQSSEGNITFLGVVLMLGAVIVSAAFAVLSRSLSGSYTPFERTYFTFLVAFVGFIFLTLFTNLNSLGDIVRPCKEPGFWLAAGYISICSGAISYTCAHYANTYVPLARTASFANLATVFSMFAGVVFLHESIDVFTVIMSAIVLVCAYFAQMAQNV